MMRVKRPKWKEARIDPIKTWKILRGDRVEVLSGKNKGQRGEVKAVVRSRNMVLVEGVNLVKKHQAGSGDMKGGVFTKEAPVPVSSVALIDPSDDLPCKTKWVFVEGGEKARQSKRTGVIIPRNDLVLKARTTDISEGPLDTLPEIVQKETFAMSELVPQLNWNLAKRKD